MKYLDIIYSLREIESEIEHIETEIISEFLNLEDINFLLRKERTNFSFLENKLKKIKSKLINKINPLNGKYNTYQLLKIYPYYSFSKNNKEQIYKDIKKIIKEDNPEILEDVFFFYLFEGKEKELLEVFKLLAKNKNLKVLNIMKRYFIFKNHIVNYKKTIKLIDKITKNWFLFFLW